VDAVWRIARVRLPRLAFFFPNPQPTKENNVKSLVLRELLIATREVGELRQQVNDLQKENRDYRHKITGIEYDLRVAREDNRDLRDQLVTGAQHRASLVEIVQGARHNTKIKAIKGVRAISGLGLKEAKLLVDEVW
jgi:ribosomal protein L7/L12